jgi:hypothetical protein
MSMSMGLSDCFIFFISYTLACLGGWVLFSYRCIVSIAGRILMIEATFTLRFFLSIYLFFLLSYMC